MVDHRRTLSRKAVVLPGWFLVLTALLCLVGAGGVAALALTGGDDGGTVASPAPSATPTPSPTATTASPTPSPSASPEPSPTPEPEETKEPEPEVERSSVAVSVLNASRTTGLARQVGARVSQVGWTLGGVGNWRGSVPQNTVHYPVGREAEAELLADDLGIGATAPALNGMRTDRLTVLVISLP